MPTRIDSVLLSLCLSLCATSAMALPIEPRVTIDTGNGSASGTVVDVHPTTGDSKVYIEGHEDYEGQRPYDKNIHADGAAAKPGAVTQSAQNTTVQAQPQPSAANAQLKYKVGQPVEYVDNGKWYKAIITEVRDDSADHYDRKIYAPYRVHPLGYNGLTDRWVCCADFTDFRSQLRPAGSGPTEPVPGGEANDVVLKAMRGATAATPTQPGSGGRVPAKQYHCVYFVGNQLVDAAPLTITGNSTYTGGTYSLDSASSTLTFRGGDFDGQRAEYETSGGRPQLHILGKSGRRVIDCD
jgi:hypothetical protein